ncbi:MAG: sugar phosphate isomerase/epimerase family protein [Planctomycetota bacterium]
MNLRPRIGLRLSRESFPVREGIRLAKAAGCDAVQAEITPGGEITPDLSRSGRREFRHLLEKYGLALSALAVRTGKDFADPAAAERAAASLVRAVALAGDIGAPVVTLAPVEVPEEGAGADALHFILRTLVAAGEPAGVRIAPGTGTAAPEILEALDKALHGTIGFNLDPAADILAGRSPGGTARRIARKVVHVQARDARRGEGDPAKGVRCVLGEGAADVPVLARILLEADYEGFWTVGPEPGDDPAKAVKQAANFLRRLEMPSDPDSTFTFRG